MKLNNPEDPAELAHALDRRKSGLHWERLPGLTPRAGTIIDVGAGGGVKSFYEAFPAARFVIIDALEENGPKLRKKTAELELDCEIHIVGVGAKPGTLQMNVPAAGKTGKSSFLERSGAFSDSETQTREVPIRRLDEIVPERPGAFGLKIDAEGFEKEVLLGAPRVLKQCNWVVCETSMSPRFVGDPLFAGIYRILDKAGFVFRDFIDLTRQGGGDLRRIDAVFVKAKYVNYPRERREKRIANRAKSAIGGLLARVGV